MSSGKDFAALKAECEAGMYDRYLVQCKTTNQLLGGWPKRPIEELAMLKARLNQGLIKEDIYEAAVASIRDMQEGDHVDQMDDAVECAWTGFPRDDDGIFVASRQIKAALKECASVLGLVATVRGSRQILQHAFFAVGETHPDQIRLYRTPHTEATRVRVTEPDGHVQLVGHVMGPQGPRSIVKRHDYVQDVYFEFVLFVRDYKHRITLKDYITPVLVLMQSDGLGASRSQGYGRLTVLDCVQVGKASAGAKAL